MPKKLCGNCGKDMGEHEPYEDKMTLVDICKRCVIALNKIHERSRQKNIAKFLLTGKF